MWVQRKILLSIIVMMAGVLAHGASADSWSEFESDLAAFRANSKEFMSQIPRKSETLKRFSNSEITSNMYVQMKLDMRKACMRGHRRQGESHRLHAAPEKNDQAQSFLVNETFSINLEHMEQLGLNQGKVSQMPWAGDYWPIARGTIAQRVFDERFSQLKNWQERYNYFLEYPLNKLLANGSVSLVTALSPSEKLELLVGDLNSYLTHKQWEDGKRYQDEGGNVEEWMGICHGWAPASYSVPSPRHAVTLPSYNGEYNVTFLPDEIKGLVSYLWAKSYFDSIFVGGRCNEKEPSTDENGRVADSKCFDSNPATWHTVITHKLGVQNKSFVMDSTFDYEVWNQPVVEYEYRYFNPETSKVTPDLREAEIPIHQFEGDRFKKYRSKEAKSLVGIAMRVAYIIESETTGRREVGVNPPIVWVDYLYDLEIGENGEILGGEWYSNNHPDFLWTPAKGAMPTSHFDRNIDPTSWDGRGSIPKKWQEASVASHYSHGQILSPLVMKLLELSQGQILVEPARISRMAK